MSLGVAVLVGLLGGVGAVARFALDGAVSIRLGRDFPYGTLVVNLAGAFVLGVFVGASLAANAYRLAGTGAIGAFTTFSTWALESHRLGEEGERWLGLLNIGVSLAVGIGAAWLGRKLGSGL